ncbi:MAG: hypothetical protein ACI94O_002564 [Octadecabacter sp.]|jgi:hypothetical protein
MTIDFKGAHYPKAVIVIEAVLAKDLRDDRTLPFDLRG